MTQQKRQPTTDPNHVWGHWMTSYGQLWDYATPLHSGQYLLDNGETVTPVDGTAPEKVGPDYFVDLAKVQE